MPLSDTGIFCQRANAAPISAFQVLGERNTGTNYCRQLILENLGIPHTKELGWKHGFPQVMGVSSRVLVVVIFREPYAWLRSMYAKPWHCAEAMYESGFSAFLRVPWDTRVDRPRRLGLQPPRYFRDAPLQQDRNPLTGACFENVLALRTLKAQALLGWEHRGCNLVMLRYETLKADPAAALEQIAQQFDMTCRPELRLPQTWFSAEFDKGGAEARREEARIISPEDRAFIQANLDPALEARLGYRL